MNESKRTQLSRLEMIDFLVEVVEYLDPKEPMRVRCEKMIEDAQNDRPLSIEALQSAIKEIGRAAWAPRIALKAYLKTPEGAAAEWKGIAAAVRNSTEHLLERFKAGTKVGSIDEALTHAESASALKESERTEIREVRVHLWPVIWHAHQSELGQELKKAKDQLNEIQKKFSILRDMAFTDSENEKQILGKIEQYEDQLFGEAAIIPLEILDDEIGFFRDMKPEE